MLFPSSTRSGNWLVQAGKNYLAIRPGPDDRYNLVGRAIFLKRSFDADSLVSDKTSSNTDSDTPGMPTEELEDKSTESLMRSE